MSDEVHLRIPATTAHIGLARATAAALAARLDFTYDRLTDLHIALDEGCGRVLATAETTPERLHLTFGVRPDGLAVEVRGDRPLKPGAEFLNAWSRLILESIAGAVDVEETADGVVVRFLVSRGEPV